MEDLTMLVDVLFGSGLKTGVSVAQWRSRSSVSAAFCLVVFFGSDVARTDQ